MLLPQLQEYVVVTKSAQFIGKAENRIFNSINNGCIFDNAKLGHPGHLNFYGLPYGKLIETKMIDFYNVKEQTEKPLQLASIDIPKDQIFFFFDLRSMKTSGNTPEKMQIERQYVLETVYIRFEDLGGLTFKGQTYLHRGALACGVIRTSLKDNEWFIMQFPKIVGPNAEKFEKLLELEDLCMQNECFFDHIMVKANRVVTYRDEEYKVETHF